MCVKLCPVEETKNSVLNSYAAAPIISRPNFSPSTLIKLRLNVSCIVTIKFDSCKRRELEDNEYQRVVPGV